MILSGISEKSIHHSCIVISAIPEPMHIYLVEQSVPQGRFKVLWCFLIVALVWFKKCDACQSLTMVESPASRRSASENLLSVASPALLYETRL